MSVDDNEIWTIKVTSYFEAGPRHQTRLFCCHRRALRRFVICGAAIIGFVSVSQSPAVYFSSAGVVGAASVDRQLQRASVSRFKLPLIMIPGTVDAQRRAGRSD